MDIASALELLRKARRDAIAAAAYAASAQFAHTATALRQAARCKSTAARKRNLALADLYFAKAKNLLANGA